MAQTTGFIDYVQEGRFRLDGDDGCKHLFLLSPRSSRLPEDLRAAQSSRLRVRVEYQPQASVVAGLAQSVDAADAAGEQLPSRGLLEAAWGALRDWSLPRQIRGQSEKSDAATSSESRKLGARLKDADTIDEYLENEQTPTGWWHNFPKCAVSLLKAWYGEHAIPDNDWGHDRLPKIVGDHSQLPMTLAMRQGCCAG